jgi:large subunit ribosomal protein L25
MSETILVAESGRATGSADARRLRRDDRIPGVVYGHGMDPISVSVARRDLRLALSGPSGSNTVLDLTVDGTVYPAIVKEMQRHPVRRTVQHVDFIQVNLDEQITVSVPVRMEGEAKAVLDGGGLVDLDRNELEVRTTPRNIPDELVVDISDMDMDTTITIGDLKVPRGVTILGEPDWAVVTVLTMRASELESDAEAAEGDTADDEAAEGEAAEGEAAEGAADSGATAEAGDDAGE